MSNTYLDNVKASIKRQMNWAGVEEGEARIEFLDQIIKYCEKLKKSKTRYRTSKTRHGAGRK